jgi:hypothetical protein
LLETRALLIYLIVIGTLIVLQDCTPILKRLEKVKFDPRFLEKLASFQGNKEYIDKRAMHVESVRAWDGNSLIKSNYSDLHQAHNLSPPRSHHK